MGSWGNCDFRELKKLQRQLEQLEKEKDTFCRECAKELAARLLRKVVQRTPVGDYSGRAYQCRVENGPALLHGGSSVKGLLGGTLRRNWTVGEVRKNGGSYEIEIINPTEYSSYVEYGHRTADHRGWVPGHFMLTISEKEIQKIAPRLLEKKLEEKLREVLNDE